MKIADRPQLFHLKILGAENTATNLQIKFRANIPEGSIIEGPMDFAFSIQDFLRTSKENHRHELRDNAILIKLARHNLR